MQLTLQIKSMIVYDAVETCIVVFTYFHNSLCMYVCAICLYKDAGNYSQDA